MTTNSNVGAVNIAGTFKQSQRPDNGLTAISKELCDNPLGRHVVVGIVSYRNRHLPIGEPEILVVKFDALEPLEGEQATQVLEWLNDARRKRELDAMPVSLFDGAAFEVPTSEPLAVAKPKGMAEYGTEPRDPAAGPWPGDPDYQAPAAEPAKTRRPRAAAKAALAKAESEAADAS